MLVSDGGRRARNCALKSIVNGSTLPSHRCGNGAVSGVGRHSPAPVPPRSGGGGGCDSPVTRPPQDDRDRGGLADEPALIGSTNSWALLPTVSSG